VPPFDKETALQILENNLGAPPSQVRVLLQLYTGSLRKLDSWQWYACCPDVLVPRIEHSVLAGKTSCVCGGTCPVRVPPHKRGL